MITSPLSTCVIYFSFSTSPSVYLQVVGTLAVVDHCATVGPILTSPIITFPPGGLSTWKPPPPPESGVFNPFEIGATWVDPLQGGVLDPLTIKDLACPTWGLGRRTSANGKVDTTIGPPWLPLIVPPSEAFFLDPTWADLCTGMESDWFALKTFAIFDPPIALTVESRLVPFSVSADPTASPVPTQAEAPVDPTIDPPINPTTDPTTGLGGNSILSSNAARPASSPVNPTSPVRTGDPVANSPRPSLGKDPNDPVAPADSALKADEPPADPSNPSSTGLDPLHDSQYISSVDPNSSGQPYWAQGDDVLPQNQASVQEAPVLSFAGSIYTLNQASQFLVAGETLTPGGVVTVSGMPISMDSDASIAVIGGSTQLLKDAAVTPKPVLTFAGSVYTAGFSNEFFIAGKTLTKGGVIVIDGTRLSLNPSGTTVVIGSSTQAPSVPIITAEPGQRKILTFHGSTYTADGSSNFIVDGQTLAQGSAITADGTQVSYDQAGFRIIVGNTGTQILAATRVNDPEQETVLTFDGSTYTADSSTNFVIDGHTLSKGGVTTVDGTRLSYDPEGSEVVIGTSTQSLATPGASTPQEDALLTFDGSTFTADSSSDFVIDGQTLSKGAIITVDSTRLSYNQQGSAIVIGTSTQALSFATITPAPTPTPVITFDGSTYYANDASSSEFVIDGQTLTKGGVVTVDGTLISYAVDGTDVVVGTSTEEVRLGDLIMSGFGGGGGESNSNEPVLFTGKAARGTRSTKDSWVVLSFCLSIVIIYTMF